MYSRLIITMAIDRYFPEYRNLYCSIFFMQFIYFLLILLCNAISKSKSAGLDLLSNDKNNARDDFGKTILIKLILWYYFILC